MILQEISEFQKLKILHKEKQGSILLTKNRQVGLRTKHIDICHKF